MEAAAFLADKASPLLSDLSDVLSAVLVGVSGAYRKHDISVCNAQAAQSLLQCRVSALRLMGHRVLLCYKIGDGDLEALVLQCINTNVCRDLLMLSDGGLTFTLSADLLASSPSCFCISCLGCLASAAFEGAALAGAGGGGLAALPPAAAARAFKPPMVIVPISSRGNGLPRALWMLARTCSNSLLMIHTYDMTHCTLSVYILPLMGLMKIWLSFPQKSSHAFERVVSRVSRRAKTLPQQAAWNQCPFQPGCRCHSRWRQSGP